jgi:hypothetical protein
MTREEALALARDVQAAKCSFVQAAKDLAAFLIEEAEEDAAAIAWAVQNLPLPPDTETVPWEEVKARIWSTESGGAAVSSVSHGTEAARMVAEARKQPPREPIRGALIDALDRAHDCIVKGQARVELPTPWQEPGASPERVRACAAARKLGLPYPPEGPRMGSADLESLTVGEIATALRRQAPGPCCPGYGVMGKCCVSTLQRAAPEAGGHLP